MVFKIKHISCIVLVKYISEPIICLYKVTSTISEDSSFKRFKFFVIRVVISLQSIIPNLFRIYTTYFPWFRKISFGYCHTSRPKKYCIIPRSFISNYVASFFLHSLVAFPSPIKIKSSTHSSNIVSPSSSTL